MRLMTPRRADPSPENLPEPAALAQAVVVEMSDPIELGISDAAENHDHYLYGLV